MGGPEGDSKPRYVASPKRVLKLFDLSSESVRVVERNVFGFCLSDERLLLLRKDGRRVEYEPRTLDRAAPDKRFEVEGAHRQDPIGCRVYLAASVPGVQEGRRWRSLRTGDGVLDYGKTGAQGPQELQHRNSDGSGAVQLDLTNDQINTLRYIPFAHAYFLYKIRPAHALDDEHTGHRVHWFTPGKPIRHVNVPIPASLPEDSSNGVFPTRDGYLLMYQGGAPHGKKSATQGLHLAGGKRLGRVLAGYVSALAISPDGCKVAAIHAESIRAKRDFRSTLKVLDLCQDPG